MVEKESAHGDGDEMAGSHWEFDVDEETPEIPVAEAIADLEDADTAELSPIYNTVDDLINRLFSDPPPAQAQARIEFSYEGYRVLIHQDGHATIMPVDS